LGGLTCQQFAALMGVEKTWGSGMEHVHHFGGIGSLDQKVISFLFQIHNILITNLFPLFL
jgi:hypothetical protein